MLSAERLRQLLDYDPETGDFRWRVKRKGVNPGDIAGSMNGKGYRQVQIDCRYYRAHRLAWLFVHSRWPVMWIDHKNGNRLDNRISNLREATPEQSAHNRRGHCGSKTKTKGIYERRGGKAFEAWIMKAGKHYYLGQFSTPEQAAAAYADAAITLYGEFAYGRSTT